MSKELKITGLSTPEKAFEEFNDYLLEKIDKLERFYIIVKTKEVDIGAFKTSMKGEPTVIFKYRLYLRYNDYYSKQTLSKEEFKFLKEMLKEN